MIKIDGVDPCTNHGCVFGHPGGTGTNGQCHCLDIRSHDARIRATRNMLALRAALAAERAKVERLRMAGRFLLDCPHIAERDMEPAWADSETEKAVAEMRAALEDER